MAGPNPGYKLRHTAQNPALVGNCTGFMDLAYVAPAQPCGPYPGPAPALPVAKDGQLYCFCVGIDLDWAGLVRWFTIPGYLSGVVIGRVGVGLEEKLAAVKIEIFPILTDSSGKPTMRSK